MSDVDSWYSEDEVAVIVLDNGSRTILGGLGGQDAPTTICPTVVGESKVGGINLLGESLGNTYYGDDAITKKSSLELKYPVVDARVDDLATMEKLWRHIMKTELRVVPDEQPVLMNVKPNLHNHDKEDITEMMFEKFQVPSLYLAADPTLVLMSTGRVTGLVLDCGYHKCRATPCYESLCIPHASSSTKAASEAIEAYLTKILTAFKQEEPDKLARKITTLDYSEIYASKEKFEERIKESYDAVMLNQTQRLDVKKDLDIANEAKFQPSVISYSNDKGVHEIVIESVEACDPDLKWDLLGNVVLSGGGSMVQGLPERLQNELEKHYKPQEHGRKVKVIAAPERLYSSWIGGSTLSSLSIFDEMLIKTSEYEECGPYVVRRKCFS